MFFAVCWYVVWLCCVRASTLEEKHGSDEEEWDPERDYKERSSQHYSKPRKKILIYLAKR